MTATRTRGTTATRTRDTTATRTWGTTAIRTRDHWFWAAERLNHSTMDVKQGNMQVQTGWSIQTGW
jgi:hypothetical protein